MKPFLADFPVAAFLIGMVVFLITATFVSKFLRGRLAPPPRPPGFKPVLSEPVQNLARDRSHFIDAIKLHREQTGVALAQAKSEIEWWLADQPKS
jgi:hypothetical protein